MTAAAATRPVYEKPKDLTNADTVIEHVCAMWHWQAVKLKKFSPVDFALTDRDRIRGWAEIKCRTNESTRYPTYSVSLHKVMAGVHQANFTGLPYYVVIGFTDGVWYINAGRYVGYHDRLDVRIGGRTDRNDPMDIEPMVHIPVKLLRRVEAWGN